jgi:hypothetical protein
VNPGPKVMMKIIIMIMIRHEYERGTVWQEGERKGKQGVKRIE